MSRWHDDDDDRDDPLDEDVDDESTYPCPGCGRQIYEEADACPYCGEYVADSDVHRAQPQPWWVKVVILLLIVSMVGGTLLASLYGFLGGE